MRVAVLILSLSVMFLFVAACSGDPAGPAAFPGSVDVADASGQTDLASPIPDTSGESDPGTDEDALAHGYDEVGKACAENADCESGYCVPGEAGYVCTVPCVENCPYGYACKASGQLSSDGIFLCFPVFSTFCQACATDTDCGGGQGRCVEIGGAKFCTEACQGDGSSGAAGCPDGWSCPGGDICVPDTGSCVCTAELDGSTRPCEIKNEFGTCLGVETCNGAAGWAGCSAGVASAEICDGQDNNCNGFVDELLTSKPCALTNDHGTCAGVESCAGEVGWSCDAPTPAEDVCDGLDNDCDAVVDPGAEDLDADGQADCVDSDLDGDLVPNPLDNCPTSFNLDQLDLDADGQGDVCDSDKDGDGVENALDLCPNAADPLQTDTDDDGSGDVCDDDDDGDGVPDGLDCAPLNAEVKPGQPEACNGLDDNCNGLVDEAFADSDGDAMADCLDEDDDGDSDPDVMDCAPLDPAVFHGAPEVCNGQDDNCDGQVDEELGSCGGSDDSDGDGDPDLSDCAPLDPAVFHGQDETCDGVDNDCDSLVDEGFADTDGDQLANCVDSDDDNDGAFDNDDCATLDAAIHPDAVEQCNGVDDNCDQGKDEGFPDTDGDGVADCVDLDLDGDGVSNALDNCVALKNPDQANADGDGLGDLCDPDDDNDGVLDGVDVCPLVPDPEQLDNDDDQVGNACDGDDDGDGVLDGADCAPLDNAVYPGAIDVCNGLDDNCNQQVDEGFADSDQDGLVDCFDPDDDNDGVLDALDNCALIANAEQTNSDDDALGDVCDSDDDGDSVSDALDCAPLNPQVKPGNVELCNGLDDNCDSLVDEGFGDNDADGLKDCIDPDDDNDSVPDAGDNCPLVANPGQDDADNDGKGDACDGPVSGGVCGDGAKDAGEQCDNGNANSNTTPNACRLDCTVAGCGDSVADDGEGCDDGNPFADDGCDPDCSVSAVVGLALPYAQNFDTAASFEGVGWLTTGAPTWILTGGGPLGPDKHARMLFAPGTPALTAVLRSPILDASGHATVTATLTVQASADANDTWALSLVAVVGNNDIPVASWTQSTAPSTVHVDLSAAVGNQAAFQLELRVTGNGADLFAAAIDDLQVRPGAPPSLGAVANQTVEVDATAEATVNATDSDTPLADLSFELVGAPDFVDLQPAGAGSVTVAITPQAGDVGFYADIALRVSDGIFSQTVHFDITVKAQDPTTSLVLVILRDKANGQGSAIGDVTLDVGEPLLVYAAGYGDDLSFVGDVPVVWKSTGTLDAVPPGPNSSRVFTPISAGTVGTLQGNHPGAGVTSGETGLITVVAAPPGDPDAATSTVASNKSALVADGVDSATITVALFDAVGQPVTEAQSVVIQTTGGTLVGAVKDNGDGTYTQTLVSAAAPGQAILTGLVNGQALADTAKVKFVEVTDVIAQGTTTIDCDNYAAWKDKSLVVVGGTLVINSAGCAPMDFGELIVKDTGLVTHDASTQTEIQLLDIRVTGLQIDAGGLFDVSDKGYRGGTGQNGGTGFTFQNQQKNGAGQRAGATHGGLGGGGNVAPRADMAYGDFRNPSYPGAGGGFYNGSIPGGHGGGLARIEVLGTAGLAVVHGEIRANGANANGGGGAGGSIRLKTAHLNGTGHLVANGGNGNKDYAAGGGGGGRIALLGLKTTGQAWTWASIHEHVQTVGGFGWSSQYGGAGSVFVKSSSSANGELLVDNEGKPSATQSTRLVSLPEGVVDTLGVGNITDFDAVLIEDLYAGTRVNPKVGQNEVGLTDDTTFAVLGNSDQEIAVVGDPALVAAPGDKYRGVVVLDRLHLRGQARLHVPGDLVVLAGNGGPTQLDLLGHLSADTLDLGATTTVRFVDGGLDVGTLVAVGQSDFPVTWLFETGELTIDELWALSITGDKATITTGNAHVMGHIDMTNPSASFADIEVGETASMSGGTAVAQIMTIGQDLMLDATSLTVGQALVAGTFFQEGGTTEVTQDLIQAGVEIHLTGDALLRPSFTTPEAVRILNLKAPSFVLDPEAVVDTTGRGYSGGNSASGLTGYAAGNQTESGAGQRAGGSHGGRGSAGNVAAPAAVYDDHTRPFLPGGGGGAYNGSIPGGAGGSAVRVLATTAASINGTIRANGANANGGGGSGGAIQISAPNISGNGMLEARGGTGNKDYAAGGGGGGRIALVDYDVIGGGFTLKALAEHTDASGGFGWGGQYGGAGTVYLEGVSQTFGDLLLDNKNKASAAGSTPLKLVPEGQVDIPKATEIVDYDADLAEGNYVGTHVRPDITANDSDGFADDFLFKVVFNDDKTLKAPDGTQLLTETSTGKTYRGIMVLDHLAIRGRARVATEGDIWVRLGELGADDPTVFTLQGELDCQVIDLSNVEKLVVEQSALNAQGVVSHNSLAYAFDVTANGASLTVPHLWANDATLDGSSLTTAGVSIKGDWSSKGGNIIAADMAVSGNATFDGGTISVDTVSASGTLLAKGSGTLTVMDTAVSSDEHISLGAGFVLTHGDTTTDSVYQLALTAPSIDVAEGASIDVSGRGYKGGNNQTGLIGRAWKQSDGAGQRAGGSYGGLGSPGNVAPSSWVYSSPYKPAFPGAGGGAYNGSIPGGDGGGFVSIHATSELVVDGKVLANGADANGGGGSGGGIVVRSPVIYGTGSLESNGGIGNKDYASGGGGGGRVAILDYFVLAGAFEGDGVWDVVSAHGGFGWGSQYGGAGTIYVQMSGLTFGDLIIDNDDRNTPKNSTPLLGVGQGKIDLLSDTELTDFDGGWEPDFMVDTWVNLDATAGNASLADNGLARVTANDDKTLVLPAGTTATTATSTQKTYRAIHVFRNFELRGKAAAYVPGDLWIQKGDLASGDTTSFVLGGSLEASNLDLSDVDAVSIGSGSLVSIDQWVAKANPAYPFDLTVDSGTLVKSALVLNTLSGSGGDFQCADSIDVVDSLDLTGTSVVTPTLTVGGSFVMSGGTLAVDTAALSKTASLSGGCQTTIGKDSLVVGEKLTVSGANTTLTHTPMLANGAVKMLHIQAKELHLDSNAVIDVSGKGYRGAKADVVSAPLDALFAPQRAGGSHGGLGGAGNIGGPAGAYDPLVPVRPGAGGGFYNGSILGGQGGGLVRIETTGAATINGVIRANGANANGGGGAGGGVHVDALFVSGTGSVEVRGGNGNKDYASGGGGGGRVALLATVGITGSLGGDQPWDAVKLAGGSGWGSLYGGAGTLLRRVASQAGDLVVDNEARSCAADSTPLVFAGTGVVDEVTATSLGDFDAQWQAPDLLAGYQVNPKTGQGGPSLSDDVVFQITANTTQTVELAGIAAVDAVSAVGDQWSAFYAFDNLEVRGSAQLHVDGELLVHHGDLGSGDDETFVLRGGLRTRTLDIQNVDTVQLLGSASGLDVAVLVAGGELDPALAFVVEGEIDKPDGLTVQSLAGSGGTLTTGHLQVLGDLISTDTSVTVDQVTVGGQVDVTGGTHTLGVVAITGDVVFDSATVTLDTLDGGADVTLLGNAQVTVQLDTVKAKAGLMVGGTSALRHGASTVDLVHRLVIEAVDVTVAGGAAIDANGRGWPGGTAAQPSPAWPGDTSNSAGQRAGGSHGGRGASGNVGASGISYDTMDEPNLPGSGGAFYNGSIGGGAGGGVVLVVASQSITVAGAITANGANANGGGGAGGTVFLQAPFIGGTGTLAANGGTGNKDYAAGGGGGGRIAFVDYDQLSGHFAAKDTIHTHFTSHGGLGWGSQHGGAGTVFWRSAQESLGHLLVDNGNKTTFAQSSPLVSVGQGVVDKVLGDEMTDFDAVWQSAYHVGTELRPDVSTNGSATLTDDTFAQVLASEGGVVTLLPGNVGAMTAVGKTYRGVTRLLELRVGGKAQAHAQGDLLVTQGDLGSGATFVVADDGKLTADQVLELVGVPTAQITGDVSAPIVLCADCP